jgi:AcrR family transcriptional regulator
MSDETPATGSGVPRAIGLLWGIDERPTRGPRPTLTIDAIVDAAVAVADTEGVTALSMARIAGQLGYTTMSLYRYVASKDELLMLITDAATGPPPDIEDPGADWRADLTRWAWAIHTAYGRHPWVVQIPILGPPLGPNNVGYLEAGLAALAGTGLTEQEKANTVLLLSGFVRNTVSLAGDLAEAEAEMEAPPLRYGQLLAQVVDATTHPAVHRAIESGIFDDDEGYGDAEFVFGLERVLDGIAALVEARAEPRVTAGPSGATARGSVRRSQRADRRRR